MANVGDLLSFDLLRPGRSPGHARRVDAPLQVAEVEQLGGQAAAVVAPRPPTGRLAAPAAEGGVPDEDLSAIRQVAPLSVEKRDEVVTADSFQSYSVAINDLVFSPDDKQLVTVGEDGAILVWNLYLE